MIILRIDRGMFFEGVFENLEGITNIPNRQLVILFHYYLIVSVIFFPGPISAFKVIVVSQILGSMSNYSVFSDIYRILPSCMLLDSKKLKQSIAR